MQTLLDWLGLVDWGQYNFFKYILLVVICLLMFDGIISFVYGCVMVAFNRGRR